MRSVCLTALAALSILASAEFAQAQGLVITNYKLVGQQNITPTKANMTYQADLVNSGPALSSVAATVTGLDPFSVRVVAGQDTLNFSSVPAGGRATSNNTFTIQIDPTTTFDFNSKLQWSFVTTMGGPVANAGLNQTATVGSQVMLNGSNSTSPSGAPLSYNWAFLSLPSGSQAYLAHSSSVTPTFIVDVPGTYIITLTVSDGQSSSSANVTVSTSGSTAPIASAGPNQIVSLGATVILNGNQSTSGSGKPLTYAWAFTSFPQGSAAILSGANTVSPSFVADKNGSYMIQLIVNDGTSNSAPSTVTVSTKVVKPVANAGPNQTVNRNDVVKLNGAGSTDANGLPLTYQWSLISRPQSSTATLSNPVAVNPTFTADASGTYVAQLIVNNGVLSSDPVTVTITANPVQQQNPTANAGPNQTVTIGTTVTLNGSGTDPQSLPLTYQWTLLNKPVGSAAVLSSTAIPNPTFVADLAGTYIAQLVVNNGTLSSTPATVTISTGCSQPTANAGPAQSVNTGVTVTLNGAGSGDVCNDALTYSWSFTTRPSGSTSTLSGATSVSPTFVPDLGGTYVVQLIVNNGFTNSNPATVTITATAPVQTADIILPVNLTIQPGDQADFTVTLAKPAGPGGVFVSLSSSDPSIVSLRASNIIIREGDSTSSQPKVNGGNVGAATITATASGLKSASQTVQVTNSLALKFQPNTLNFTSNAIQNLVLTLSSAAPASLTVNLTSSNPSVATVASTATFFPGTMTVNVPVIPVAGGTTTIHASALPNIADTTATVTVPSVNISVPSTASVNLGQSAAFAITVSPAAPAGGLTVNLSSSDASKVTVPASVFIAAGATTPASQPQVTGTGIGSATITASANGYPNATGTVSVPAPSMSFSGSPLALVAGNTGTLTLNLSGGVAPAGGLTIILSSSDSSKASVPATVVLSAGASSAPVTVTGVAQGTATITATATGIPSATATVNVSGPAAIVVAPVSVNLGQTASLLVTLPTAAPAGGVTVNLSSSDTSKVTIPATVFIAAGATTPATAPQVTGVGIGSANITASASGYGNGTGTVTVPAPTLSFSGPALSVTMGNTGTLTLNLNGGVAPAGGLTINLSSSDTSKATVPATVNIAAGASTTTVTVTAVLKGSTTITASATGIASATALVTVTDFPPISVSSLSIGLGQSDVLQVSLSTPAVAPVTITLVSSDTSKVTVTPTTVTIATGASSPASLPQLVAAGIGSATITASATGYSNGTGTVTVPAPTMSFSGSPLAVTVGSTANLTLNLAGGQAPAAGLVVNLTSSNTGAATVPATVTFPGGSASATVTVTGVATGSSTITASSTGIASATATANVTPPPTITLGPVTVGLGQTANMQVTISPVQASGLTVNLASSDGTKVSVSPASITIPAGSTTGQVQVTGLAAGSPSANITASATGFASGSANVNVTASLTFSNAITVNPGGTGNLTMTLTGGVAPPAGLSLDLSSSNTAVATVPPSVAIPAGATSATVTVTGVAGGTSTISASAANIAPATVVVSVPIQITVLPTSVALGLSGGLQVSLAQPAPAGGVTLNLASTDTSKVTVQSTVTINAGATVPSTLPQVTGAGIGQANITAASTGFVTGISTVTVTAPSLAFTGSPISINLPSPATGTQTLTLTGGKAPAGGLTIALSSSDPNTATVPATVSFAPGATTATVTVTGVNSGTATITASATGIAPATTVVTVIAPPIQINVPPSFTVTAGQTANYGITLALPAPSGGLTVNFTSSDPTKVSISPASVTVPAGAIVPTTQPHVVGLIAGASVITASGPGLVSASSTVTVPLSLSFAGDVTVNAGATALVTLSLRGGVAPSGGLNINVITNPSSIATVQGGSAFFAAGSTSAIVTVQGVATGSALLTANGAGIPATSANITVLPAISPLVQKIVVPAASVGKNLQVPLNLSLLTMTACTGINSVDHLPQGQLCSAAGPGGALVIVNSSTGQPILFPVQSSTAILMTVTSSDPTKLLIGVRGNCPGVAVPTKTVVCGAQEVLAPIPANLNTASIYLQGLDSSGTVTITATAPGYPTNSATITLTPSGFQLVASGGGSSFSTFTGAQPSQLTLAPVRLDSSLQFAEYQALRTGYNDPINGPFDDAQGTISCNQQFSNPADVQTCEAKGDLAFNNLSGNYSTSVTIASTSPQIGGVLTPITVNGNDSTDVGYFVPQAQGDTTLTAVAPPTFSTPASGASVSAHVGQPQTSCITVSVGQNLETTVSCTPQGGTLTAGLPVTVTSNDPTKLLVSAIPPKGSTCTDAGSPSITFSTVNVSQLGQNIVIPAFCVYGLGNSGTATYTINIQGYALSTGTVNLSPSGFVVSGPGGIGAAFDIIGTTATITVYSARLDANLNYVAQQPLAIGQSVNVSLTSSQTAAGTVSPATLPFTGGQVSNATTFTAGTGGTNCPPQNQRPATPCTVIAAVAPAGFSTPATSGSVTAYVTVQNLSLSCGDAATPITIGQNLETSCFVSLSVTNPAPSGGISVTLTSGDSTKLIFSGTATALGLPSISITIPGGSTQSTTFYIQALDSSGTPTYTAAATGYPTRTGRITLAPSGVVIAGPNGLGANFFTTSSAVPISVYTAALTTDVASCPAALGPPCLLGTQPLRGGIPSLQVTLSTDDTTVGTVTSPVTIQAGNGSALAQFTPVKSGQTKVRVATPAGYTGSTNNTAITATIP